MLKLRMMKRLTRYMNKDHCSRIFFFDRKLLRIWMVTTEVAFTPALVIQIKLHLDHVDERLLVFCSFVFQNLYTVCDLTLGLILNKVDAWFIE